MAKSVVKITGDELDKVHRILVAFIELMQAAHAVNIAPDELSLLVLQEFIERLRDTYPADRLSGYATGIGIVLGEALIRAYGGHWVKYPDGRLAVRLDCGAVAYPIERVHKQIADPECSIIEFFRGAALLAEAAEKLKSSEAASVTIETDGVSITAKKLE